MLTKYEAPWRKAPLFPYVVLPYSQARRSLGAYTAATLCDLGSSGVFVKGWNRRPSGKVMMSRMIQIVFLRRARLAELRGAADGKI